MGVAAHRKRTSQILSRFIDETGIPLFSTQMGKGVVDERHPLFLGNAALSATTTSTARLSGQTVINVGRDVVEKPPFFMSRDGFRVIHINFSSAYVDPVYFPGAGSDRRHRQACGRLWRRSSRRRAGTSPTTQE